MEQGFWEVNCLTNKPDMEKMSRMYNDTYEVVIEDGEVKIISHAWGKRRILSQFVHQGYRMVRIKGQGIGVHRMVAKCFIGECPAGLCVNHKDGIKTHNLPENLEYVTRAENTRHAYRTGLHVACDPTKMPTYKDGRTMGRREEYKREWYKANRERVMKRVQARYQEKREEILAYTKQWHRRRKSETPK